MFRQKIYSTIFLLHTLLFYAFVNTTAQDPKSITDSLKQAGEPFLLIADSSIIILNDTVMILAEPDSNTARPEREYEDFYNAIRSKANRNFITRELFSFAFSQPVKHEKLNPKNDLDKSENSFIPYQGKKIRTVHFRKLSPFGTSVNDTTIQAISWSAKTANKLHTESRDNIIMSNLLFNKGDTVNPIQLADNERILRDLIYIRDARIEVIPVAEDSADIIVITKDVWSLAVDGKYYSPEIASVRLYDRNIFGTGQHFENDISMNLNDRKPIGYSGSYLVNNLFGSFISTKLTYTDSYGTKNHEIDVYRSFLAHEFNYAGGIKFQNYSTIVESGITEKTNIGYNFVDAWLSRSYKLKRINTGTSAENQLFAAGRVNNMTFSRRPAVEPDSNYLYFNKSLILATLAMSKNNYFTGTQIYTSGLSEEIPYGYLFELTFGKEFNEFQDRYYAMMKILHGGFFGYAYLNTGIIAGGFIHKNHWEQSAVVLKANAFSKKIIMGGYAFRQFIDLNYTFGINRFDNENLHLNGDYNIRGLNGDSLKGNYRLICKLEQVAFMPKAFWGFETSVIIFEDIGFISPHAAFHHEDFYAGFGPGFRVGNENLFFSTLQISFAYYPVVPSGGNNFLVKLTGINVFKPDNFIVSKPDIVRYD